MGAGKQWTAIKNLLYVKVIVQASEDPENGVGQKKHAFETKIADRHAKLSSEWSAETPSFVSEKRTGGTIVQRFKTIRKGASRFKGIYAAANASKFTSGPTEEALLLYLSANIRAI